MGEVKLEGFEREDFYSVLPAIGFFISKVKSLLPNANIIFLINDVLKPEIKNAIKKASDYNGTRYLALSDIGKQSGHPNVVGMIGIKEQVKKFLLEN